MTADYLRREVDARILIKDLASKADLQRKNDQHNLRVIFPLYCLYFLILSKFIGIYILINNESNKKQKSQKFTSLGKLFSRNTSKYHKKYVLKI